MADSETKTIEYDMVVDAQQMLNGLQQLAAGVNQLNDAVHKLSADMDDNSRVTQNNTAELQNLKTALTETATAEEEVGTSAKTTSGFMDMMNGVIDRAITQLGAYMLAAVSLQKVIQLFQDSSQAAIDYSSALFQLEAAVDAMRQSGMDTTLEDWTNEINSVGDQFKIFTQVDLTQAAANIALMTRNTGLDEQQMFDLFQAGATLAATKGLSLADAMTTIGRAMDTGVARSLANVGVIMRGNEEEMEAEKLGIQGTSSAWTDQETHLIRHNVIMEQTASLDGVAADKQTTLAGKVDAANVAITKAEIKLGSVTAGIMPVINQVLAAAIDGLASLIGIMEWADMKLAGIEAGILSLFVTFSDAFSKYVQGVPLTEKQLEDEYIKNWKDFSDRAEQAKKDMYFPSLGGEAGNGPRGPATTVGGVTAADEKDLADQIEKIQSDSEATLEKDRTNFNNKMIDIATQYDRDMENLKENYYNDLNKLDEEYNNGIITDREKLNNSIANENATAAQDKANAIAREAIAEEKAEQDLDNRLLQLRNQYLLNLEDAVQQRNARAVLQLNEKYNLDRNQTQKDAELQEVQRKQQLAFDEQEIEIKRRQRIAEMIEQEKFQEKQQADELAFQKRMLVEKYEQEQADAKKREDQQEQDNITNYDRQQTELEKSEEAKIKTILDSWVQQGKITQEGAENIYNIIKAYLVDGVGNLTTALSHEIALINNKMQQAVSMAASSSSAGGGYGNMDYDTQRRAATGGGYAEGGSLLATQPTTAVFGEAGPELVSFTPLGRQGADVGKLFSSGGGAGGLATVRISLSEGLEGKIVDNTMGAIANVILSAGG